MGKKTFLKLSVTCTMCLTVAVCYPQDDNAIVIDDDDNSVLQWLNGRPYEYPYSTEVPITEYTVATGNVLQEYIRLLAIKPYIAVEEKSYLDITGTLPKKKYVIAIRAVCKGAPDFTIVQYEESDDIKILNLTLGVSSPMRKAVVFIEVDRLPPNVFVHCIGPM